ncbi:MAG: hypothetical protein AB1689_04880 [Thermodesulfobacteriota bacterium]
MQPRSVTRAVLTLVPALALAAGAAVAAPVTPPATRYQSSLVPPTPATGTDFEITKASQVQVSVSSGNVTFKLKLNGVVSSGVPVSQTGNTFQADLRYGGVLHTVSFVFDLANGKTNNAQTKFTIANGSLPGGGVAPDDSIEVRTVRCLQGGAGPGAGLSFCSPGLTAK